MGREDQDDHGVGYYMDEIECPRVGSIRLPNQLLSRLASKPSGILLFVYSEER